MDQHVFSVFPLTKDVRTLLSFKELLDINIKDVFSYKEDARDIDSVKQLIPESWKNNRISSNLLVPPDADLERLERFPIVVKQTVNNGNDIWLSEKARKKLNLQGQNIHILDRTPDDFQPELSWKKLYEIPVPIIAIMSSGVGCDKFLIQLAMKRFYQKTSYKAASICSNPLGSLSGMFVLPNALFDGELEFSEKVVYFNHYLRYVYAKTKPDLMIVGVPGGTLRLPDDEGDYFSEFAHLLDHAIDIDAAILSLYYDSDLSKEKLESLEQFMLYKYGAPVYAFCLATTIARKILNTNNYEMINAQAYIDDFPVRNNERSDSHMIVSSENIVGLEYIFSSMLEDMRNGVHAL